MELERTRSSESRTRAPALSSRCVMRVVNDANLGTVLVYEPEVKDQAPALVFENDAFFLRVFDYPRDWRKLPDRELMALSDVPL